MTGQNKRKNIADELAMSAEAWGAALRNAAAADYKTAAGRLYYAAYHAATAILLSEGLEPKSHRGLLHLLQLHFVVPGKLPQSVDTSFSRLQTEREMADYEPGYSLPVARYQQRQAEAEELIQAVRAYLSAGGWL